MKERSYPAGPVRRSSRSCPILQRRSDAGSAGGGSSSPFGATATGSAKSAAAAFCGRGCGACRHRDNAPAELRSMRRPPNRLRGRRRADPRSMVCAAARPARRGCAFAPRTGAAQRHRPRVAQSCARTPPRTPLMRKPETGSSVMPMAVAAICVACVNVGVFGSFVALETPSAQRQDESLAAARAFWPARDQSWRPRCSTGRASHLAM